SSCYPQTTLVVAEQLAGVDTHIVREKIRLYPALDDLPKSAQHTEQEAAVIALRETLDTVELAWQRIEFGRTRSPSPKSVLDSRPKTPFAVFVQTEHASSEA